jgi:photosystem I subunit 10
MILTQCPQRSHIGKSSIKYPQSEPALPSSNFFGGFGLPALLATTSFGHLLGVGVILGLHNLGQLEIFR